MTHDVHTRRILDKVAESTAISQRSLSRELGIALGLTNLLLRRLVARGWIGIEPLDKNHVRYVLTPVGFDEKARLSRDHFLHTVRFYTEARDRVEQRFTGMLQDSNPGNPYSIVFYGVGEIAEIGWVCVQRTALRLVGIVDDEKAGRDFFGLTVLPVSVLAADRCNRVRYDRLIVTAEDPDSALRSRLALAGVDAATIVWL